MSAGKVPEVTAATDFGTDAQLQLASRRSEDAPCAELESGSSGNGGVSARASAYQLRETEIALEERERELARELEQMAEERAMLGGLETELARAEASCDELNGQIETMTRQLREADGDRSRLERELQARETDLAAGGKELSAREREIEERRRELETRVQRLGVREQELETQGIELSAQERALALAIDHLTEKSGNLRFLEITLDARSQELDEREHQIEEKLSRLERAERPSEKIEAGYAGKAADFDWRRLLAKATEKRLTRIEQDLQGSDIQPQDDLQQGWDVQPQDDPGDREGGWWARQLGQTAGDEASKESVSGGLRAIK